MEVVPLAPPVSPWFPVGVRKLAVMCVGTLGLYQVYWFYEQWRHAAAQEDEDIWPWARAVFGVLFCYPLFERMGARDAADRAAAAGRAGPDQRRAGDA
jgi:hypothetical protein